MQGTIRDAQGAVVPGATITVTSLDTGRAVSVHSNEAGDYGLAALQPGGYKIEVQQTNFKTVTQQATLQVQQVAVLDFALQPGTVSQTVEVSSDVTLVDPATSNVSEVVVGRQITELPLNGRNFTQLATLAPGVTRGVPEGQASGAGNQAETFRYGNTGGAALSINGLRPQANNFLLDGVDNNESLVNTIIFFPPAEAIQEFRVDTSVAPAEYGRAGGGVVNTSIKSGTNQYHGSLFWFLRNDNLDARPFFSDKTKPKPEFKRHQFGGTFGGPIIKNKLFIFGDYQGLRQYLPFEIGTATVPTPLMRAGNFSELLTLPTPIIVHNPVTGLPFATPNVIDPGLILPQGQAYLNAFPGPNVQGTDPRCALKNAAGVCIQQNYAFTRTQIQHFDDFDIRADWNMRTQDTMFVRYSYGKDEETTGNRLGTLPSGFGAGLQSNYPRSWVIGQTHTFGSTVINEFRAAWVRTKFGYTPPFNNVPMSANFGIPNANTIPLLGGSALIGGGNGSHIEYVGDFGPYLVPENTFQYSDNVSWMKGRHNLRFGATILRRQVNLFRPSRGKGFFSFNEEGGPTGYEVSDMLAGFTTFYESGVAFGTVGTRNWETGYYVQDDWHFSDRLTLNLGIRYDLYTWPTEVENRQANFDINTGRLVIAGQGGATASTIPTDKNNWAPRIGFAYRLSQKSETVLRGGYGVFYFVDRGGIDNQLAQNAPFSGFSHVDYSQGFRVNLAGCVPGSFPGSTNPDPTAATAACLTSQFPKDTFNIDVNNPTGVTVFAALPTNRNSYVQQWNLQLERALGANTALTIAYVGTKGTKLATYYNLNRQVYDTAAGTKPYPQLGNVNVQNTNGGSIYHGLQVFLERRMSKGLQFNAAYTWSHAIDDSPGAFDQQTDRVDPTNFRVERASSNLDVRHRFVFSSLYELPFGRGRQFGSNAHRAVDLVLGGWQVNPIITLMTGFPFDLISGFNQLNTRPDLIGTPHQIGSINTLWFDKTAFANPPTVGDPAVFVHPGTAPRNLFTGPGTQTVDMSFFKNFKTTERINTQFRAEFFNLLNTPQFAQPNGNIADGNFGRVTATRLGTERQIQFALRISF